MSIGNFLKRVHGRDSSPSRSAPVEKQSAPSETSSEIAKGSLERFQSEKSDSKNIQFSTTHGRPYLTLTPPCDNWDPQELAEAMHEFFGRDYVVVGEKLAARLYKSDSGEPRLELSFTPKRNVVRTAHETIGGKLIKESVASRMVLRMIGKALGHPKWESLQTDGFSKVPRRLKATDVRNEFDTFCSHPKKFNMNGEAWKVRKNPIGYAFGSLSNPILRATSASGKEMVLKPMGGVGHNDSTDEMKMSKKESAIHRQLGGPAAKNSNILRYCGELEFGGAKFICTDYASKGTMKSYAVDVRASNKKRAIKQGLLLESLQGAIAGMKQTHKAKYLHLDIKLENFFVQDQGGKAVTQLADFGTAQTSKKKKWAATPSDVENYMSPEMCNLSRDNEVRQLLLKQRDVTNRIGGLVAVRKDSALDVLNRRQGEIIVRIKDHKREITKAADVWPLGPMIYELFCGELSPEELSAARGDGGTEPRALELKIEGVIANRGVRDALNELIINIMKPDPKERWSIETISDYFDKNLGPYLPA